jgi:hypothetical protein
LRFDPIRSLLSSGDEALRYFVRRDLLEEQVEPIRHLWQLPEAQKILKRQQPDGSWTYMATQSSAVLVFNDNTVLNWSG